MATNVYHVENTQKDKKVDEKAAVQLPQITTESTIFQLIFLKDDEYPSVEVLEVEEIDFEEIIQRLSRGESVFITRKRIQALDLSTGLDKTLRDPWYFTHI